MQETKPQPFELKNELLYQERYVRDMVKLTEKQPAINSIYEQWLQFTMRVIRICEKRNRF